jgi:lauroyl/myristoyl acyltransferase
MDAEQAFRCIMGALLLACFIQLLPAFILLFMFKILGDVMIRIREENAGVVE